MCGVEEPGMRNTSKIHLLFSLTSDIFWETLTCTSSSAEQLGLFMYELFPQMYHRAINITMRHYLTVALMPRDGTCVIHADQPAPTDRVGARPICYRAPGCRPSTATVGMVGGLPIYLSSHPGQGFRKPAVNPTVCPLKGFPYPLWADGYNHASIIKSLLSSRAPEV